MGVFEQAKGKIKQAIGDLTDQPNLRREGQAQADKGEAEREAQEARAKAQAHEKKADVEEQRQQSAESS